MPVNLKNLLRTKLKSEEELLAMEDDEFQDYFDRRMRRGVKRHPEDLEEEKAFLSAIYSKRNPVLTEKFELPSKIVKPAGDPYTYRQFSDGSIEILTAPAGKQYTVGRKFPAGSKAANIVAQAVNEHEKGTTISGFDDVRVPMLAVLAAAAGGIAGYRVAPKYVSAMPAGGGAVFGAMAGWFLGKRLAQTPEPTSVVVVVAPRSAPQARAAGLVSVGNVNDYWGNTAWNEADDQEFIDDDQFGYTPFSERYGY